MASDKKTLSIAVPSTVVWKMERISDVTVLSKNDVLRTALKEYLESWDFSTGRAVYKGSGEGSPEFYLI